MCERLKQAVLKIQRVFADDDSRLSIRFLFIGSCFCSTPLSDSASRRRLCASLSLHFQQVVKRTSPSKLSNVLGAHHQEKPAPPGAGYIVHRGRLLPDQAVVNSHAGAEIPACSGAVRTATAGGDIGEVRTESHVAVDQGILRVAAGLEASRVVNDSC